MFEVYVLVCIINTTDCTELVDTKGPYETRTECKHRVIEMRRDFDEVLIEGVEAEYSYKCKRVFDKEI